MLPAYQRLNSQEVAAVFAKSKRLRGNLVHINYRVDDSTKAAAVVGKKLARSAVRRNYLRRRLYHTLRNTWNDIPEHIHLVLILTPQGVQSSFQNLEREVHALLEEISL